MTALHAVAPTQRTGSPAPSAPAVESPEALELLRAAEAFGTGGSARPCAGSVTCGRPGALTVVTEQGTSELCGLHAMAAVFSTAGGPMVVVRPQV